MRGSPAPHTGMANFPEHRDEDWEDACYDGDSETFSDAESDPSVAPEIRVVGQLPGVIWTGNFGSRDLGSKGPGGPRTPALRLRPSLPPSPEGGL